MSEEVTRECAPGEWDGIVPMGDDAYVLVGGGKPDFVRHPETGARINITAMDQMDVPCPMCKEEGLKRVFMCEEGSGFDFIVECQECAQYSWCKKGEPGR